MGAVTWNYRRSIEQQPRTGHSLPSSIGIETCTSHRPVHILVMDSYPEYSFFWMVYFFVIDPVVTHLTPRSALVVSANVYGACYFPYNCASFEILMGCWRMIRNAAVEQISLAWVEKLEQLHVGGSPDGSWYSILLLWDISLSAKMKEGTGFKPFKKNAMKEKYFPQKEKASLFDISLDSYSPVSSFTHFCVEDIRIVGQQIWDISINIGWICFNIVCL